jgi:threonine dehydrogenase-like Zn-dependent dehydrogenase
MVPERLKMAADAGAITIDNRHENVYDRLLDLTGGIGPDICIDAVGMEAHGSTARDVYDKIKTNLMMETERPASCGRRSTAAARAAPSRSRRVRRDVDKIPMGALMNKGLTIKTGQTHVHRYVPELLDHIRRARSTRASSSRTASR